MILTETDKSPAANRYRKFLVTRYRKFSTIQGDWYGGTEGSKLDKGLNFSSSNP